MWLQEQLTKLDSPDLEGLVKEVFSENGALEVKLSDVMARLARLGEATDGPRQPSEEGTRVLAIARTPRRSGSGIGTSEP
eukprot:9473331-Pyramimonas_sp.AAC.1